jgi:hypothetical protein
VDVKAWNIVKGGGNVRVTSDAICWGGVSSP